MINKYGFWIVILAEQNGNKDICYDYVDGDYTSRFDSEEAADNFVKVCKETSPKDCKYYCKYIPWGEFA